MTTTFKQILEGKGSKIWAVKLYGDEDRESYFDDLHICSTEA